MPYLMEICFDNDRRLPRKYYLFEYKGIKFKLVQSNPRKWADHLLTVLPNSDVTTRERTYTVASEFLSALSWENTARIGVSEFGGKGWRKEWRLSRAAPSIDTFPKIPYGGNVVGYNIVTIPKVETDEQRIALTLFREAGASNNEYLSFLFYWQVLETGKTNPIDFANNTYRTYRKRPEELRLRQQDLDRLQLNSRHLGEYLNEDCRHAIAHIKRRPERKKLELDSMEERLRISISTRIVRTLSEYYIRHVLNLQKKLHLVRRGKRGFPTFVDDEFMSEHTCIPAYR